MKILVPTVLAALALTSCIVVIDEDGSTVRSHWSTERGSGTSATETRTLATFTRIRVEGSTDVEATSGTTQSVTVTADDNLIDRLTTRVEDGVLVIATKSGSYDFRSGPKVKVACASLAGVSIVGSGDVRVDGVDADTFQVAVAGSGDARVAGKAKRLEVNVAGSGDVRAFDLAADDVTVSISGSGSAHVQAVARMSASVSGSGDVRYRGAPKEVQRSIAGSGTVEASAPAGD